MINAQEARYLQKIEDGLSDIFGTIEKAVQYAAKHGNSQVEIDFHYTNNFEDRLMDIINILDELGFKINYSPIGYLRVEW